MDRNLLKYLCAWTPIVLVASFLLYGICVITPEVGMLMMRLFVTVLFLSWFSWGVFYLLDRLDERKNR